MFDMKECAVCGEYARKPSTCPDCGKTVCELDACQETLTGGRNRCFSAPGTKKLGVAVWSR